MLVSCYCYIYVILCVVSLLFEGGRHDLAAQVDAPQLPVERRERPALRARERLAGGVGCDVRFYLARFEGRQLSSRHVYAHMRL